MVPSPYMNDDVHSFAYDTARVRWPKILVQCIEDLSLLPPGSDVQWFTGKFKELLSAIDEDKEVQPFTDAEIKLNPSLKVYNEQLTSGMTWKTGPWLYLECYLYQYINNFFISKSIDIDIFQNLKQSTLISSKLGIIELCKKINEFDFCSVKDDDKLIFFKEFIDISLWGNSTDLSLLAGNVTLEDIKSIQGAETRKANEKNILVNGTTDIFTHLSQAKSPVVDIVLDNSGFEVFSDIVLAIYLIETKLAGKVTFHCKKIPWFVSDTLEKDFDELFKELIAFGDKDTAQFVDTVKSYISQKKFVVTSDDYWTLCSPYWTLPRDSIYEQLKDSTLVIFKGDLNYRKLTGDVQWDKTTPFETALQDLKGKINVVSLRTCKADVTVGLPEGVDERLKAEHGEFWSSSGKYAVISFCAKD